MMESPTMRLVTVASEEYQVPPNVFRSKNGWQIRFEGAPSRYFGDAKYGGIAGSLAEATKEWKALDHTPSPRAVPKVVIRWTRKRDKRHPDEPTECELVAQRTHEYLKKNPSGFGWAMTRAQEDLIAEGLLAKERRRDPDDFHRSQQGYIIDLIEELREKEAAAPKAEEPLPAPDEQKHVPTWGGQGLRITPEVEQRPEQSAILVSWGAEEPIPPPQTLTQRMGSALADILRHPDLPEALGMMIATAFRSEAVQEAIGEVLKESIAHAIPPQHLHPSKPVQPAPQPPPKPTPEPATAMETALQKAGEHRLDEDIAKHPVRLQEPSGPKPKVLVVGLNPRQVNEFQREFGSALNLHFYYEGDSKDQLRQHARHCDYAFSTFTKSGSSADMILRANIAIDKSPNHKPMGDRYMRAPASPHAVREKLLLIANGGLR